MYCAEAIDVPCRNYRCDKRMVHSREKGEDKDVSPEKSMDRAMEGEGEGDERKLFEKYSHCPEERLQGCLDESPYGD